MLAFISVDNGLSYFVVRNWYSIFIETITHLQRLFSDMIWFFTFQMWIFVLHLYQIENILPNCHGYSNLFHYFAVSFPIDFRRKRQCYFTKQKNLGTEFAFKTAVLVFNTVRYRFACFNIQLPFVMKYPCNPSENIIMFIITVQLATANCVAQFLLRDGILLGRTKWSKFRNPLEIGNSKLCLLWAKQTLTVQCIRYKVHVYVIDLIPPYSMFGKCVGVRSAA